MGDAHFSITYPLCALKRGSEYVAYDLSTAQPPQRRFGVLVFTTKENAGRYLRYTETLDQIVIFDRVNLFRHFLRSVRDQGTVILFDLLPDQNGNLTARHTYPAAVVLERFLPEGGFTHDYPVYVLKLGIGFACVSADHEGTTRKMLVVFTDADLAERAVAAAAEPFTAVPVADRKSFAQLLRSLSADVEGAAFDPPDPRRGGRPVSATLRPQLLANLEMEI